MTKSIIIPVLLLACSWPAVNAENVLDRIALEVVDNNPTLKASIKRNQYDRAELSTVNNLEDPEIEVAPQFGKPGQKVSVDASQSFDWPGVYSARAKAADASSRALDYLDDMKRVEVLENIKNTLLDIITYKKSVALFSKTVAHIDSMMATLERAVEKQEVSLLDLNKLRIERLNTVRRLNEAALQYSSAVNSLEALNGGLNCSKYTDLLSDYPMEPLQPLGRYKEAMAGSPSLRYAAAQTDVANLNKKVLLRSNLPGFSVGYNYEYDLGDHYNGFKVGLTLPFFSNKNKKAALDAEILALEAEQQDLVIASESEINDCYQQISRLDKEIEQYAVALNNVDNIRLLTIAYEARHITLLDYLQDYNYFLDAQEQLILLCNQREQLMLKLSRWL